MLAHISLLFAIARHCSATPVTLRSTADDTISLPTGQYTGYHDDKTSTTTYYAIPYAYASRFEPSKLIDTKPGISPDVKVNTSTHGPACINFNIPPPYDKGYSILLRYRILQPWVTPSLRLLLTIVLVLWDSLIRLLGRGISILGFWIKSKRCTM